MTSLAEELIPLCLLPSARSDCFEPVEADMQTKARETINPTVPTQPAVWGQIPMGARYMNAGYRGGVGKKPACGGYIKGPSTKSWGGTRRPEGRRMLAGGT